MAVIFATSSARDLHGNAEIYTGTAQSRDTNYSDEEIRCPVIFNTGPGSFEIPLGGVEYPLLWLHFRMFTNPNISGGGADGSFVTVNLGLNLNELQLDIDNGQIFASASVSDGADWAVADSTLYTIDMRMESDGTDISCDMYVDGVLTSSATRTLSRGGVSKIQFALSDMESGFGTTEYIYFSEIICDDAESTIGCRLHKAEPSTAGTYSEWTGAVSDIQDPDDSNVIIADANNERFSWNPPAYTGDTSSGTNVRAVLVYTNLNTAVETEGPDKFSHFLRVGATDYYNTQQVIGGGNAARALDVWTEDPSTTAPWDVTDMGTFEIGIRAET